MRLGRNQAQYLSGLQTRIYASVAQLVEQSAFNRLVAGSSPAGGIMKNEWMRINHADGTQKVFFSVGLVPKCFDMASTELTDAIMKKIHDCEQEIAIWKELLEHQKDWINGE